MPTASAPKSIDIQSNAVVIDWFAEEDTVRVVSRDKSRFEVQKDYAITVLRVANDHQGRFSKQFQLFMEQVQTWLNAHHGEVRRCMLTVRDSRMLLIAVPQNAHCNDGLEDALSEFDLRIFQDPSLDLIRVNTMVIPEVSNDALQSFVDAGVMLLFNHAENQA